MLSATLISLALYHHGPGASTSTKPEFRSYASSALDFKFTENRGQWNPKAKFMARGQGVDVWVTSTGLEYLWHGKGKDYAVAMEFVGASGKGRPEGVRPLPGVANYILGKKEASPAHSYEQARIADLYPGIDLVAYFDRDAHRPRYDLVVHPGADASRVRVRYSGAKNLAVESGAVRYDLPFGRVAERKLLAYQESPDGRETQFIPREVRARDGSVGFKVDGYRRDRTLVIDPLVWSTFIGGSTSDACTGVVVSGDGTVLVTGNTKSSDFPQTNGSVIAGAQNAFVASYASTGALNYATYFGGNASDSATGIAADGSDDAYVCGNTTSTNLPVTDSSSFTGTQDAFVACFSSTGGVTYAKYLGGSGTTVATAISESDSDSQGSGLAVVVGTSSTADYPTANALDSTSGGAFITKVTADGSSLIYSTFFGGTNNPGKTTPTCSTDSGGFVFVGGSTTDASFPTLSPYQSALTGTQDGFLYILFPDGQTVFAATYIGGNNANAAAQVTGIAIDSDFNIYLAGRVVAGDYPVTAGAYSHATVGTGHPIFVTKFNVGGATLGYSSVFGGSIGENPAGIAVDPYGNALVAGTTTSADFPITNAIYENQPDAGFLAQLSADGTTLAYGSYFPGHIASVNLDLSSNAVLAGSAGSTFPTTSGTFKTGSTGMGFVTTLQTANLWYLHVISSTVAGNPLTGTVAITGVAPLGGYIVNLSSSVTSVATVPASVTIPAGQATATFNITTYGVAANTPTSISATSGTGPSPVTKSTPLTVDGATLESVVCTPGSTAGGNTATGTLTFNGAIPSGAAVTLSANLAGIRFSTPVLSGISGTFSIVTSPVSATTAVVVTAKFNGVSRTSGLSLTPTALYSIRTPVAITGGKSGTGTVVLTGPAPSSGPVKVFLASDKTSAATVPTSVNVPAGATSATFTITTTSQSADATANISANITGGIAHSLPVVVYGPENVATVSCSPNPVMGGVASTGTFALDYPAPTGGVVVTLASDNPSAVTVPARITVPAGQTTATFAIATTPQTGTVTVNVSAQVGTTPKQSAALVVYLPLAVLSITGPTELDRFASGTYTITLNQTVTQDSAIFVGSAAQAILTNGADGIRTITVPAGSNQVTVQIENVINQGSNFSVTEFAALDENFSFSDPNCTIQLNG